MSYGRTGASKSARGDPTLKFAGAALLLVGFSEAMIGFLLFTWCNGYFENVCASYPYVGSGFVLGLAGVFVLVGGAIVYFLGRRVIVR